MRGSIHQLAWRIPEEAYHRALKTEAEVVEGSISDLLWDLLLYRYAMQRVVDALWDLDKIPSKAQAHQIFYNILRSYGFRAHVVRNIYIAMRWRWLKPLRKAMEVSLFLESFQLDWITKMLG